MPKLVRTIAIGNKLNVAAWHDNASAEAEIARIVGLAAPHLATEQPNLIVLGELLGLPGGLMGWKGAMARRQKSATAALTLLALADLPNVLAQRRRFPGITLVQALLLARADALYRPLAQALPQLARRYQATIVAGTAAPRVTRSTDPRLIRRYGWPGADQVYLAAAPGVYNIALVATPDGRLARIEKVYLTASEAAILNLTPGDLSAIPVIATPAGRLGIAISLDAFTPAFLEHIDRLGAEIVVQPDANDQPWAAPSKTADWQPQEWLNAVLGSIQHSYPHLWANVCAMQVGHFFDVVFDGQSSITMKSTGYPRDVDNFVGNSGTINTATKTPMTGTFLAVAPWVAVDPARHAPEIALAERRQRLTALGRELAPGGPRANQYHESVIWADVALPEVGAGANVRED